MQTTPNLGMTIPSGDGDPFDEMVFSNALVVVDTFAGHVADKAAVAAQVFAGSVQAPSFKLGQSGATVQSLYGAGLGLGGDAVHASWSLVDNGPASHQCFVSVVPDGVSGWASIVTSVVGDAGDWRFYMDGAGAMSWSPGNAARDTSLQRVAAGQLALNAKLIEGNTFTAVNVPATYTPNLAAGLIQRVQVNAGGAGTLTIAAPQHPPSGAQTALLVVHIANFGGGTIGIAWNAVYVPGNTIAALPANLATGKITEVLFVWDGGNWRIVSLG